MPKEPTSRQGPDTAADDKRVHDAILALALHRYAADRRQAGQQISLETAAHIARLAELRGLQPARDVRLLGFELHGTAVQPLDDDTLSLMRERVDRACATYHVDWICRIILGRGHGMVEALVTGAPLLPKAVQA